jgi:hypothetical protein
VWLGSNHFLYAQREAFRREPRFHAHQLAAVEQLIAQAPDFADERQFIARTDRYFLLAKAACQDRAANQLLAAQSVDDPWLASAAAAEGVRLSRAKDHADLHQPSTHAGPGQSARFASLVRQLFTQPAEAPLHAAALLELDPSLIHFPPRFRWRFPWPVPAVREWLGWPAAEMAPAPPAFPWPKPLTTNPPPPSIFDLYCARPWPEPLLRREAETAQTILAAAETPTALEALSVALQQHFQITACWNQLFLDTLLAPVAAMENLEEIMQFAWRLSGCAPQAVWDLPRTKFFREHNLSLHVPEDFGALDGEAGFPLYRCPLPGWRERSIASSLPHKPHLLFFRDQPFDSTQFVIPSCL